MQGLQCTVVWPHISSLHCCLDSSSRSHPREEQQASFSQLGVGRAGIFALVFLHLYTSAVLAVGPTDLEGCNNSWNCHCRYYEDSVTSLALTSGSWNDDFFLSFFSKFQSIFLPIHDLGSCFINEELVGKSSILLSATSLEREWEKEQEFNSMTLRHRSQAASLYCLYFN